MNAHQAELLTEAFADALDQLEAGRSLGAVSTGQPELDGDIRPLLATAQALRSVRYAPAQEFRACARAQLVARVQQRSGRGRWLGSRWLGLRLAPRRAGLAFACVCFCITAALAWAAAGEPGNPLHPIRAYLTEVWSRVTCPPEPDSAAPVPTSRTAPGSFAAPSAVGTAAPAHAGSAAPGARFDAGAHTGAPVESAAPYGAPADRPAGESSAPDRSGRSASVGAPRTNPAAGAGNGAGGPPGPGPQVPPKLPPVPAAPGLAAHSSGSVDHGLVAGIRVPSPSATPDSRIVATPAPRGATTTAPRGGSTAVPRIGATALPGTVEPTQPPAPPAPTDSGAVASPTAPPVPGLPPTATGTPVDVPTAPVYPNASPTPSATESAPDPGLPTALPRPSATPAQDATGEPPSGMRACQGGPVTVAGLVQDAAGSPVPNAQVVLYLRGAGPGAIADIQTQKTNASGQYRIPGQCAGTYDLVTFQPGPWPNRPPHLEAGAFDPDRNGRADLLVIRTGDVGVVQADLRLAAVAIDNRSTLCTTARGALCGTVFNVAAMDARSMPTDWLVWVVVVAFGEDGVRAITLANESGDFALSGLEPGTYRLLANSRMWFGAAPVIVHDSDGDGILDPVVLDAQSPSVGRVLLNRSWRAMREPVRR